MESSPCVNRQSTVFYSPEINRVSGLAARALKAYHSSRTHWSPDEKTKAQDLLSECYVELKKLLIHYIESKKFPSVLSVYVLLAEVAFCANDYYRSIKYYTQAVSFNHNP